QTPVAIEKKLGFRLVSEVPERLYRRTWYTVHRVQLQSASRRRQELAGARKGRHVSNASGSRDVRRCRLEFLHESSRSSPREHARTSGGSFCIECERPR